MAAAGGYAVDFLRADLSVLSASGSGSLTPKWFRQMRVPFGGDSGNGFEAALSSRSTRSHVCDECDSAPPLENVCCLLLVPSASLFCSLLFVVPFRGPLLSLVASSFPSVSLSSCPLLLAGVGCPGGGVGVQVN